MRNVVSEAGRKPVRAPTVAASAGTRAGLDRDRLIETALDLLQQAGLDALSTRRMAERLGVKSSALYWHVRNKQELLGLIADAICAQMALPEKNLPVRERLEEIAWEYRRVLIAHRDAPRLFAEQAPTGPHRIKLYDAAVGAFLDSGLAPPEAIAMATFYRNFLLGMIAEEARQLWRTDSSALPSTLALGVELSHLGSESDRYANLRGAAELFASISSEALFRLGLKVLMDGMECHTQ
ncbi:MAG: TetR/AcrR family transcriptional regulator C-terminal domain-containing protein [Dokdonella sp.]